jgi:hypothetical protein
LLLPCPALGISLLINSQRNSTNWQSEAVVLDVAEVAATPVVYLDMIVV